MGGEQAKQLDSCGAGLQLLVVAFSALGCSEAELPPSSPLVASVPKDVRTSGTCRSRHNGQKGTQRLICAHGARNCQSLNPSNPTF
jgi:hypothetical protein